MSKTPSKRQCSGCEVEIKNMTPARAKELMDFITRFCAEEVSLDRGYGVPQAFLLGMRIAHGGITSGQEGSVMYDIAELHTALKLLIGNDYFNDEMAQPEKQRVSEVRKKPQKKELPHHGVQPLRFQRKPSEVRGDSQSVVPSETDKGTEF